MGRKSRSSKNTKTATRRYSGRNTLTPRIARPLPRFSTQKPLYQNLDLRFFSPLKTTLPRHPVTYYGAQAPISTRVSKGGFNAYLKATLPKQTLTCVRRQTRREVLFAARKAGKSLGTRKVRRNASSSVQC